MIDTSILNAVAGQIAVVDATGQIVSTNSAWRDTARDGHLEELPWNYLRECDRAAARGCVEAGVIGRGLRHLLEGQRDEFAAVYSCPFNSIHHLFKVTASRVADTNLTVVVHTDVTELQTDPLTGLPNRGFFESQFEYTLDLARSENRTAGVLLIDLDGFKSINDRFGHAAGDAKLRSVASTLTGTCHRDDVVARIGGDEFAIVLSVGTSLSKAQWLAGKVRVSLRSRDAGGRTPDVAASIGLAMYPVDGRTPTELLAVADHRMYDAKRGAAVA